MASRRTVVIGSAASIASLPLAAAGAADPTMPGDAAPARLREPGPVTPAGAAAIRIHHGAARGVLDGARLLTLYDRTSWAEGPVWWPGANMLVWSDVVGRRVLGWREDGAVDVLIDATPFINGNAVDRDGRLVHCEHGRRAISRSNGTGGSPVPVATHADGQRLNAPNDLIVARDGAIWFTEPTFGIENPQQGVSARSESGRTSLCRLTPGARAAQRMADLVQPNGLAFDPAERTLYVSQTPEGGGGAVAILAFDWDGHRLSSKRRFATVADGIPDGFAVDRRGWLWSSSAAGVELFDATGRHLATIPTPSLCSNCAFDPAERRLFITGGEHLWRLDLAA